MSAPERTEAVIGMSEKPAFDLVLIAASADGLAAISAVLKPLPPDFPVPVAVVLHRSPKMPGLLVPILGGKCRLPVKDAQEGQHLEAGTIYIAPPTHHLVIRPDRTLHLMDGRRIKHLSSAANPMFESAAEALHGRVIAVVLTGSGTDGTDGVQAVKASGGVVLVQDPASAAFSRMPQSAIETGVVDTVLPLDQIAGELIRLVGHRFSS